MQSEPVAWMRRWAFDKNEGSKANRPRGWTLHAVTIDQLLDDDVPLYTRPAADAAPDGLVGVSVYDLAHSKGVPAQVTQAMLAMQDRITADAAALAERDATIKGLEKSVAEEWCAYMDEAVSKAPEPLHDLGRYLGDILDEDQWKTAERYLNAAVLRTVDGEAG